MVVGKGFPSKVEGKSANVTVTEFLVVQISSIFLIYL